MHPDAAPAATLVIGATGTTGSRVAARLSASGHRVRAASRTARAALGTEGVRFDWEDSTSHGPALNGVERVYLVPPVGHPEPAGLMLPFLERARDAGVGRAVLLSSSAIPMGGPATGVVHQALPDLFGAWAVLRPSWFMQNFAGAHPHALSIREAGVIRTATGGGRVGFVDAEDIAAVAVHALTDEQAPDTDLVITGPRTLSYDKVAEAVGRGTGRPVVHERLGYEAMRDRLAASGMPARFAELLAGLDRAIADGAEDRVTDTVLRVTGRPPGDFDAFVARELRPSAGGAAGQGR
ncbi:MULTISPECIES: NAD(P)H-binding protein [Streptomyces]|uniref:NAD(P)H-binding protein n=1 Tax=Streptomyces parvus TaxID=66428 RepID=A0A5D4IG34_9ACTN|nr:NAD(P)H-binding protein [Streptomyces parvus]TYR52078.1 NAD(P)H-binding protein [Streptomyces parvus]